jgi:hypothetical protein
MCVFYPAKNGRESKHADEDNRDEFEKGGQREPSLRTT